MPKKTTFHKKLENGEFLKWATTNWAAHFRNSLFVAANFGNSWFVVDPFKKVFRKSRFLAYLSLLWVVFWLLTLLQSCDMYILQKKWSKRSFLREIRAQTFYTPLYGVATAYSTNENPSTHKLSRAINYTSAQLVFAEVWLWSNVSLIKSDPRDPMDTPLDPKGHPCLTAPLAPWDTPDVPLDPIQLKTRNVAWGITNFCTVYPGSCLCFDHGCCFHESHVENRQRQGI